MLNYVWRWLNESNMASIFIPLTLRMTSPFFLGVSGKFHIRNFWAAHFFCIVSKKVLKMCLLSSRVSSIQSPIWAYLCLYYYCQCASNVLQKSWKSLQKDFFFFLNCQRHLSGFETISFSAAKKKVAHPKVLMRSIRG